VVLCGLVLVIASCGIFDDSYGPEDAKLSPASCMGPLERVLAR